MFPSAPSRSIFTRDDGKRFIVRAEEKVTAFLELEEAVRVFGKLS